MATITTTSLQQSSTECKDNNYSFYHNIYKEFASKYENKKYQIDKEALELTNDESIINSNENDLSELITDEILIAKKMYLKYHGNGDKTDKTDTNNKTSEDKCKYGESCYAFQKLTDSDNMCTLTSLNEIEQAHIAFYHKTEFNKYYRFSNRFQRLNCRYSHRCLLSNDDLNSEKNIKFNDKNNQNDDDGSGSDFNSEEEDDDDDGNKNKDNENKNNNDDNNEEALPLKLKAANKFRQISLEMFDEEKETNLYPQKSNGKKVHFGGLTDDDSKMSDLPSWNGLSSSQLSSNALTPPSKPNINSLKLPSKLKYTRSVRFQKLLIKRNKEKEPAKDVILFGYEFVQKKGKYKNPKQEVLSNSLLKTKIKISEWNNLLRSCSRYVKLKKARLMKLTIKEIVGLKLYTDFDELQREYRKCFREDDEEKRLKLQQNFVHWNNLLCDAYKKANDDISELLYHGVSLLRKASTFNGKYYGPVSTTTILDVAKQFSGDNGIILILHSAYNKSGIKLSWLSNYPDEDEVLYMNVTFQITDIIHPKTEKSVIISPNLDVIINKDPNPKLLQFEKEIKDALYNISKNSQVITLRDTENNNKDKLTDSHKISILRLLYFQYKEKRWTEICEEDEEIAKSLANLREQFVELIEKVKAVQMDDTSPLMQDFFFSDQKKYIYPLSGDPEKYQKEMHDFNIRFDAKKKQEKYFKLQTIIRLFPEAEEISISAENWDFTLNSFVEFLEKWRLDYTAVALKFIDIKFKKTEGDMSSVGGDDKVFSDQRAIEELEENDASRNISKLLRLGWAFLSPSTLSRVPFKPSPELPFLLTFVKSENSMNGNQSNIVFYRRYTQEILHRNASHKSLEGYDELSMETTLEPGSSMSAAQSYDDGEDDYENHINNNEQVVEIHHNPKVCILTNEIWDKIKYQSELKKLLAKRKLDIDLVSPKGPGSTTDHESMMNESFERACNDVRILSLDPLPNALKPIFCRSENHQTPKSEKVISYEWIFQIFPEVDDIFLRETDFTMKECQRLCEFLQQNPIILPFERIFYKEKPIINTEDNKHKTDPLTQLKKSPSLLMTNFTFTEEYSIDDDIKHDNDIQNGKKDDSQILQEMVKMLDKVSWCFQPNGQIAFRKNIYEKKETAFVPSKVPSILGKQ